MVKHIVLFQLKKGLDPAVRDNIMNDFKNKIEQLPEFIDIINSIYVGFNINPNETWDLCLESEFDTLDDVSTYSTDPRHVAVARILKPYLIGRSCVDFEI
ncbi:MAG TPA: Dabb family protein [Alloprevotella sp.]|nr:Dabb family protein [Alloprevotella sp.]